MNTTYLKHHGILGMKWGVRRYQNADGTLTAAGRRKYERKPGFVRDVTGAAADVYGDAGSLARAAGRATKTRVGTNVGANIGAVADVNANQLRQISNEKGISRTYGNIYGYGASKARNEAFEKAAGIKSKNAYTRLGGRWAEQRSHNYGYAAKRAGYIHNSVKAHQWVGRVFKTTFSTPYERLSGRTTTRGAQFVDLMFTGGLYGLAADASYLHRNSGKRK